LSYNIYAFSNFKQVLEYINDEISKLNRKIADLSAQYNIVKRKAEKMKKIEEAFSQLLGTKIGGVNEIDLMGIKVIVGSRAVDELKVYEEVLLSLQERLEALMKARKVLEPLSKVIGEGEGISILLETLNGLPLKILLSESR